MQAVSARVGGSHHWVIEATIVLGLLFGVTGQSAADDWDAVTRVKPGTTLRVHRQAGARLVGPLVRVEGDEVTILAKGVHEIVTRADVLRIDRARPLAGAAPWIGMLIGALVAAQDDLGKPDDFNAFGHALWFGIGAGSGLAGGAVIRGTTRFVPVYRSDPKPNSIAPRVERWNVDGGTLLATRVLDRTSLDRAEQPQSREPAAARPRSSLQLDYERLLAAPYSPPEHEEPKVRHTTP